MTNELVKIETKNIGGQEINTINARDLHSKLFPNEEGTRFNDWILRVIKSCKLIENIDYTSLLKNEYYSSKPITDYILSLDSAKSICMLSKSEFGNNVRQYFIKVENRATELQSFNPKSITRKQMAQFLLDAETENEKLTTELKLKDAVIETKDSIHLELTNTKDLSGFRTISKELHLTETFLREILLKHRIISYNGGIMTPTSIAISRNLSTTKTIQTQHENKDGEITTKHRNQIFFTQKCKQLVLNEISNLENLEIKKGKINKKNEERLPLVKLEKATNACTKKYGGTNGNNNIVLKSL